MSRQPTKHACKSCGAWIYWAETATGKRIPIDAMPVEGGNVLLANRHGKLIAHVLRADDADPPVTRNRYTSHFATCPDAGRHRKAGK